MSLSRAELSGAERDRGGHEGRGGAEGEGEDDLPAYAGLALGFFLVELWIRDLLNLAHHVLLTE